MASDVRLYVEHPIRPGQPLVLTAAQTHYLCGVMRLGPGAEVEVFNGRDGAWRARLEPRARRAAALLPLDRRAPPRPPPDLWLLFAPLRKARTDFVVEKAVELGAARILPVATELTRGERIARARLLAQAVEAAEQCGATHVPEVAELAPLARVLEGWPDGRALLWADETRAGAGAGPPAQPPPAALLVGPEGGFSPAERARLAAHPAAVPFGLGPRILRAETAAVAALALWQAAAGDWRAAAAPRPGGAA